MLLDEHRSFPVRCIAREDFQHCPECISRTPGVSLRHWRFVWSLTCEICGTALAPNRTTEKEPKKVPAKLMIRAGRGATFLKSAYDSGSQRCARRVNFAVQITYVLGPYFREGALASSCQQSRFIVLAAIGMGTSHPLLKLALILRDDWCTSDILRRAFPYKRRVLTKVFKLAGFLGRKIPRKAVSEPRRRTYRFAEPCFLNFEA